MGLFLFLVIITIGMALWKITIPMYTCELTEEDKKDLGINDSEQEKE